MKKIIAVLRGGIHRGEQGRVAWGPTLKYWWALIFPARDGEVTGRALTPAEREFLARARARAASQGMSPRAGLPFQPRRSSPHCTMWGLERQLQWG